MNTRSLRELARHRGRFASVYLDISHDTEDAAAQLELRRRAVQEELVERGADRDTVAAMDAAIEEHEPAVGQAGLALVGADGEVLLNKVLRRPPPVPITRYSDMPYLLPLAELSAPPMPHVVVIVDRVGADLLAVDGDGRKVRAGSVTGDEHPVHKAGGGGWSHRSMQSRVEETVKHNIDQVAEEAGRLAMEVGARAVVVAGEVQSRAAVMDALPSPAREVAVEVEAGTRAKGADPQALSQQVEQVVDRLTAAEHQDTLETYLAECGRDGGRAVQGMTATSAALREANAEVVLVDPELVERETVWCSPSEPAQLGATDAELRGLGIGDYAQYRADEAIPFAAISVGADLQVGHGIRLIDGVGVLMRHA